MRKLNWSLEARADLDDVYDYYWSKSPMVATSMHNHIIEEAERLPKSPFIGSVIPELQNELLEMRSLVVSGGIFKIIYVVLVRYCYLHLSYMGMSAKPH